MVKGLTGKVQITEELLAEKRKELKESGMLTKTAEKKIESCKQAIMWLAGMGLVGGGAAGAMIASEMNQDPLAYVLGLGASLGFFLASVQRIAYEVTKRKYSPTIKNHQRIQEEYQELQDALLLRKQNPEITTYR